MHPAFWPMQAFVFWADVFMLPWKIGYGTSGLFHQCNGGCHKSGCYGWPRSGQPRKLGRAQLISGQTATRYTKLTAARSRAPWVVVTFLEYRDAGEWKYLSHPGPPFALAAHARQRPVRRRLEERQCR